MPPPETPTAALDRLFRANDPAGALRVADQMLAQSKRSFAGWLGRGCANLHLGRLADADNDLDQALRLAPSDPQASLLRGMVDQRLGRVDRAVDRLRPLAAGKSPQALEAAVSLAEVFWFAHRRDELAAMLTRGGAWMSDPRAALMVARVCAQTDAEVAIVQLRAIVERERNPLLRRVAGFDAVGLLDKAGRYREAFDLATQLHAATTPPFDLHGMLGEINEQRAWLEKAAASATTRALTTTTDPVVGVAMVVGLPRCGSTLLEQMLDSHSAISGIGEFDGVDVIAASLTSTGRWPRSINMVPRATLMEMQQSYFDGAHRLRRTNAMWSFDKTLEAWRFLPAIAAVLPGAVCFDVQRDARDMAISMFLSYFHPQSKGWTAKLDSIRRVIEAERVIVPLALETLGIPHESIVYEKLVADPTAHATRCLTRLGLAMETQVMRPEQNARAVFTLSHEQVRRPINSASIGRFRNYEWAFDGAWDALAETHDARRTAE